MNDCRDLKRSICRLFVLKLNLLDKFSMERREAGRSASFDKLFTNIHFDDENIGEWIFLLLQFGRDTVGR